MSRWDCIKKADVVSFDIFNTLLVRNVRKPEDIFTLVEKISGSQGFAKHRLQAALDAEKNSENGECTLDDIYFCLKTYTEYEVDELKQLELNIECKQLQANPEILPIYKQCQNLKKRIIAVSDMYLPSDILTNILKNNGFVVDKVYVSCEYKESKKKGGLFKEVVKEEKETAQSIVHIGDSFYSDYLKPRQYGIYSIYFNSNQTKDIIDHIINNNRTGEYYIDLGYSVLGPLLWSFSMWLKTNSEGIDNIIFLSRDGLIMKNAYEKMFNQNTAYIHVSRQSLNLVSLWMHCEFDELKNNLSLPDTITIQSFLKRLGLSDSGWDYVNYGIDSDKVYTHDEFFSNQNIEAFYNIIKPQVISKSKIQYELFLAYFDSYINGNNIGIVDIGWKGTMQKRLREIMDSNDKYKNVYLHGYYFGIENNTSEVSGFLYKTNDQTSYKTVIDAGFGLLESIVIAREGTTLSYTLDGAVLDEYEIKDQSDFFHLQKIHEGALCFVDKMKEIHGELYCKLSPKDAFKRFSRLVYNPSDRDIDNLGNLPFKDIEELKIVSYKGFIYYLRHLNELVRDYHRSPWKIGFLKKNVGNFIPWGRIYKLLKLISIKI